MKYLNLMAGIFLSVFIICSLFLTFAFSESWFIKNFEENGIYKNVDKETADGTIYGIIQFLQSDIGSENEEIENLKQYLTDNEVSHLKDVKNVIKGIKLISLISFFLLLIILIISPIGFHPTQFKKSIIEIHEILFSSGIFIIIFILILGLPFIINFNSSFITMHKILFPMGNWAFDPEKYLLTRILTEDIFYSFALNFIGLLIFLALLLVILGFLLKKDAQQSL